MPRADGERLFSDVRKLRGELALTQRDHGDALRLLDLRIQKIETRLFKQTADDSLQKDQLQTEVEALKSQVTELQQAKDAAPLDNVQLEGMQLKHRSKADQVAAIKTLYADKAYENAVKECSIFLADYPDNKQFGAQVLFWRGDSQYELGNHREAVLSFQELLTKYPKFSAVPETLLKVGYALDALNFPQEAKVFYEEVIQKYPKSSSAARAKERVKRKL